jgi:hypothetical protein
MSTTASHSCSCADWMHRPCGRRLTMPLQELFALLTEGIHFFTWANLAMIAAGALSI